MNSAIDIEKINKAEIKKEINMFTIFGWGISEINCSPKDMAIRLTKSLLLLIFERSYLDKVFFLKFEFVLDIFKHRFLLLIYDLLLDHHEFF